MKKLVSNFITGDGQKETCYNGWGNSYLPQWAVDVYAARHVTGDSRPGSAGTPAAIPLKLSELARSPVNKVIQGEWNWWPARDIFDKKSAWHNERGQARYTMLFGDLHADYLRTPKDMSDWDLTSGRAPVPNFLWW